MAPARTFTLAEANALIPALSDLLPALREAVAAARRLALECERLKAVGVTDDGVLIMAADYRASRAALVQAREAVDDELERLAAYGCQLKGLTPPLVDFPAVLGGRRVLFCWHLGEPTVAYYHGEADGFAGRRPIPPGTP